MHSVVYKGRRKKTIEYFAIKSVLKTQKQRVHQEVCPLAAAISRACTGCGGMSCTYSR